MLHLPIPLSAVTANSQQLLPETNSKEGRLKKKNLFHGWIAFQGCEVCQSVYIAWVALGAREGCDAIVVCEGLHQSILNYVIA